MDDLERFIMANRGEFDDEEPSKAVWERLSKPKKSAKRYWDVYWKLAAVFFLASTLYLIIEKKMDAKTDPVAEVVPTSQSLEFAGVETYYVQLIAQKRAEIAQFDNPELKRSFFAEIDQLDRRYNELKQTYEHQNSGELILDAMISNLKLRIDILDQQLKILNQLKNQQYDQKSSIES